MFGDFNHSQNHEGRKRADPHSCLYDYVTHDFVVFYFFSSTSGSFAGPLCSILAQDFSNGFF